MDLQTEKVNFRIPLFIQQTFEKFRFDKRVRYMNKTKKSFLKRSFSRFFFAMSNLIDVNFNVDIAEPYVILSWVNL